MPAPDVRLDLERKIATALKIDQRALRRSKPRMLTDAQRARRLGIPVNKLKTPFQLTPSAPKQKDAYITLSSCFALDPHSPQASGYAGFDPILTAPGRRPQVGLRFPRLKKGQAYLVEFHVGLNAVNETYEFQTYSSPPDTFEEVSLSGGQKPIVVLVQPFNEFDGALEFGVELMQLNDSRRMRPGSCTQYGSPPRSSPAPATRVPRFWERCSSPPRVLVGNRSLFVVAGQILGRSRIAHSKTVDGLSERQRAELISLFRG